MNDLMLHRAAQLLEAEFGPQWRTVADMLGTEGLLCMLCIYSDSKCHLSFPLPAILSLISHSPQNVFPVKCHHSCDQYTHLKKPHVLPNHSHTVF